MCVWRSAPPKNHGRPLADELETAQKEEAFRTDGAKLPELVQIMTRLRASAKQMTASEFLSDMIAALEIAHLPTRTDQQYLERFIEFVKEWEKRNEGKQLRDFLEYLIYFEEAAATFRWKSSPRTTPCN